MVLVHVPVVFGEGYLAGNCIGVGQHWGERYSLHGLGPLDAGQLEQVRRDLAGDLLPGVLELGLMNCEFTDAICHALVRSPLARQLTALDLSLGTLSDEGARALAEGATALPALQRLNVDENYLTDAGVQTLQGHGWDVTADSQDIPDEDHRYVSVGE